MQARQIASSSKLLLALASAALAAGCDRGARSADYVENAPPALTAATLGAQTVLRNAEYLESPPYSDADLKLGARLSAQCRACHTFDSGGSNMIGPNLHGFFGRPVASVPGFDYSAAVLEADFVWTPRALDAWLAQPAKFLPDNRMPFAGIPKSQYRDALIAFLLQVTDDQAKD